MITREESEALFNQLRPSERQEILTYAKELQAGLKVHICSQCNNQIPINKSLCPCWGGE